MGKPSIYTGSNSIDAHSSYQVTYPNRNPAFIVMAEIKSYGSNTLEGSVYLLQSTYENIGSDNLYDHAYRNQEMFTVKGVYADDTSNELLNGDYINDAIHWISLMMKTNIRK
jgi:hypothetical protein